MPLEKHLAGAKIVLISPDGPLCQLPFAALPGKDPDKYLIEEIALAVVPVPQLLPELLGTERKSAANRRCSSSAAWTSMPRAKERSPCNRAESPRASVRGAAALVRPAWHRRRDARAIQTAFRKRSEDGLLTTLSKAGATSTVFREAAGKHRWLHLANHGFFAPPELKSALDPFWSGGQAATHLDPRQERSEGEVRAPLCQSRRFDEFQVRRRNVDDSAAQARRRRRRTRPV